jgi:hypothetical protein
MFDHGGTANAATDFPLALARVPASAAGARLWAEAWPLKEIVGHRIDSAANNHRFVRLALRTISGVNLPRSL